MGYNSLTKDSGGTPDDRRSEADRIIQILHGNVDPERMTPKERVFIIDMSAGSPVTTKQLFWLRDIKDKYL